MKDDKSNNQPSEARLARINDVIAARHGGAGPIRMNEEPNLDELNQHRQLFELHHDALVHEVTKALAAGRKVEELVAFLIADESPALAVVPLEHAQLMRDHLPELTAMHDHLASPAPHGHIYVVSYVSGSTRLRALRVTWISQGGAA
jgi:hypothetical protein